MKVLDYRITDTEVWFRLELEKSTQILERELFTQEDIDAAKMEGKRELLNKILENNT